jgi:hypothetical protein
MINHVSTSDLTTPWLQSASELYRLSDSRLSAKLVPTLADKGRRVVCATAECNNEGYSVWQQQKTLPEVTELLRLEGACYFINKIPIRIRNR